MIVLCGKTASGKDSVMKELINFGMEKVVTYTTRPPRYGEEDGKAYIFLPEMFFETLEEEGFFLETTSYNAASGETWYYGTPIDKLGGDKVVILNPDGVKVMREHKEFNPIIFYISTDEETIKNRLVDRGDDPDEADRRIKADDEDFKDIDAYIDVEVDNTNCTPKETAALIFNTYYLMTGEESYE